MERKFFRTPDSGGGGKINTFEKKELDQRKEADIFNAAKIQGDEFKGKFLNSQILNQEGLTPKFQVSLDQSTQAYISKAYYLGDGRTAVVAYIEKDGKVSAQSFYRSNSSGIWRYLPDYKMDGNHNVSWYGKGYGEESITAPIVLQKALSEITADHSKILNTKNNPEFILAGTTDKVGTQTDSYYREVQQKGKKIEGNFYAQNSKTRPENVSIVGGQAPDFSKVLTTWKQESSLYGEISVEVFASKDGLFKFMFCKDPEGRVWISGVEDSSDIQSSGLRKSWVTGGDLTTPAFEYNTANTDQTGGYGNENERRGHYVDMFQKYLSKTPIIQEYLKIRGNSSSINKESKRGFEEGDMIKVKRSSGEMEAGWQIFVDKSTGGLVALKGGLRKDITEAQLHEWNS